MSFGTLQVNPTSFSTVSRNMSAKERSRDDDYWAYAIDGGVHGCAALHPAGEHAGEIAGLSVDPPSSASAPNFSPVSPKKPLKPAYPAFLPSPPAPRIVPQSLNKDSFNSGDPQCRTTTRHSIPLSNIKRSPEGISAPEHLTD